MRRARTGDVALAERSAGAVVFLKDHGMDGQETAGSRRKRVLVVEDEPFFAAVVEQQLRRAGCEVIGPVATLSGALALARDTPLDAALLDVNLGGRMSYPVADLLATRNIPFAFLTGCEPPGLPLTLQARPLVRKPIHAADVPRICESLW